jgi:glutamate-5-semialdehyde dehydrogenase
MTDRSSEIQEKGARARAAARRLASLKSTTKNEALRAIAAAIRERMPAILAANAGDLAAGQAAGLGPALLDRLMLDERRLAGIAADVLTVAALPDPVGEVFEGQRLPNGLEVSKRRVPVGVIGVIYEARPNVTVDISALCLKSGNAAILRGGKEALGSNLALAEAVAAGCATGGIPGDAVQLIASPDRALVKEMLTANGFIDMIIPRGGADLHRFALENATIPVITGGIGVCHAYVDASARSEMAMPIIFNAKVQRPTVCNALDTVLIHRDAAGMLPAMADDLARAGVELRCTPEVLALLGARPNAVPATADDFGKEFLSLVLSVKIVAGLDEALEHIDRYSTHHSEVIITEDYANAERFLDEVDTAVVYVNASTRFTDGAQLGLGAEVAISTQRLHARGPMALRELTTYKWVVRGQGQVRP